ncbi:hypothetical protein J6590_063756 [Homalodisca vitripennis]|nr:hypothetical protein J6590_063756 [Homalodisca vitripennis]
MDRRDNATLNTSLLERDRQPSLLSYRLRMTMSAPKPAQESLFRGLYLNTAQARD